MSKLNLLGIFLLCFLTGCATVKDPHPQDPLEGFNRGVYQFNDTVDRAVVKPVAQVYDAVLPEPAKDCVSNFFGNLSDIWSAFNSFLQGRMHEGINSSGRVLANSTIGVFGCFDVAAQKGAPRVSNDFGQTLGVWGLESGPYLVLPLLGPSTLRDAGGKVVDSYGSVVRNIDDVPLRNTLLVTNIVDTRASLLPATQLIDDTALDPYAFVRDAYLQRRASLINRPEAGFEDQAPAPELPNYSDE